MRLEEITRETMQALAEKMAANVGPLVAWQVQDRLNASAQVGGVQCLPKMGETYIRSANDDEMLVGLRGVLVRRISARFWIRVATR